MSAPPPSAQNNFIWFAELSDDSFTLRVFLLSINVVLFCPFFFSLPGLPELSSQCNLKQILWIFKQRLVTNN